MSPRRRTADGERLRGALNRHLGRELVLSGPHDAWQYRNDRAIAGDVGGSVGAGPRIRRQSVHPPDPRRQGACGPSAVRGPVERPLPRYPRHEESVMTAPVGQATSRIGTSSRRWCCAIARCARSTRRRWTSTPRRSCCRSDRDRRQQQRLRRQPGLSTRARRRRGHGGDRGGVPAAAAAASAVLLPGVLPAPAPQLRSVRPRRALVALRRASR